MTAPTPDTKALARRRMKKIVALAGLILALTCQALPPEYQAPCQAIVHLCTGGIP